MNENDSGWKRWQVRVSTIAGLLGILAFLFTWSPKVRDMIGELFGKKPAASVASGRGNLTEKSGPTVPNGKPPEPSKRPAKKNSSEGRPLQEFLPEQYIDTAISRREGMKQAAILVRQEGGESLSSLEAAIASILVKRRVEPVQSFFKPAFIQEGRARSLFAGDWTVLEQLQLGRRVDYVLIGFGKVTYSSNQELGGLLTADLELELQCLNVVSKRICGSKVLITQGAGFSQSSALQSSVEHLQNQVESFIREAFTNAING